MFVKEFIYVYKNMEICKTKNREVIQHARGSLGK